jgi:hypothetical protein
MTNLAVAVADTTMSSVLATHCPTWNRIPLAGGG